MASYIETIVSMAQWAQEARWTEPTEPTEPLLLARSWRVGLGRLSGLGALSQLSQPSHFPWRGLNTRCANRNGTPGVHAQSWLRQDYP
jgi:hypothetical protein